MSSKELYDIFRSKRESLGEFLEINCNHEYLKTLLTTIEVDNETKETNIIKKLFLGQIGLESNKQKAIFELPTDELLTIIKFICEFNNIKCIEEIAAGQGLLSYMLKNKLTDEYTINATDGNRWIETKNQKKYYETNDKLVLKYCLENDFTFDDKLVIISWLPTGEIYDFINFINVKKPKNIILIGDINKYMTVFQNNNYKFIQIPVKQLCYLDYFNKNEFLDQRLSKSSFLFATNNDEVDIISLELTIKLKFNECLCKLSRNITSKMIIQDVLITKLNTNANYLNCEEQNPEIIKNIANTLNYILKYNLIIPTYIKKYNEYLFWFNRQKNKNFPKEIVNREKFKEYIYLSVTLDSNDGLDYLKNNGIIPSWVVNKEMAEKCIWLDFSYPNKKWKSSVHEFQTQYRYTRSSLNRNLYQFDY